MTLPASMGRPAYRLYQLAWSGLDWLYPPNCGGCGEARSRWCQACQNATQPVPETICQNCGQILNFKGLCTICEACAPSFAALRSWAIFNGPLRNAIHRLKYKGDIALGDALARFLVVMLQSLDWKVDIITPVPLGVVRQAQRGYNQSSLLAFPLSLACGISYQPRALYKCRETASQVGLTANQRRANVSGAFQGRGELVDGKRILVVDDVATSGATMDTCASALRQAGAAQVYGLTLARAGLVI